MGGSAEAEGAQAGESRPAQPSPPAPLAHLFASLGEENTRELIGMFLQEFPVKLEKLATCGREEAHHIAHGMKSTAYHMGAGDLSRRMAELESRLALPDGRITPEDLAAVSADFELAAGDLRKLSLT